MEKCTFCVQRIREAEIAADRDGRDLAGDPEVRHRLSASVSDERDRLRDR